MSKYKLDIYEHRYANMIDYDLEIEYFVIIDGFVFGTNGSYYKKDGNVFGEKIKTKEYSIKELCKLTKEPNSYPLTHKMINTILIIFDQTPKRLKNLSNYEKKNLIYYGFYLEYLIYDSDQLVRNKAIVKFGRYNTLKHKFRKWKKRFIKLLQH